MTSEEKAKKPERHARYMRPSSAPTWIPCPAAPVVTANLPEQATQYTIEGQQAHALAADALNDSPTRPDVIGELKAQGVDTDAVLMEIDPYIQYVRQHSSDAGDQLYIEEELSLSDVTGEEGAFGTSDAVIIRADGTLIIADLKYGKGVKVEADHNWQLLCYAVAAYNAYSAFEDITSVTLAIIQPRLDHVSEWTLTVEELEGYAADIQEAGRRVLDNLKRDLSELEYHPTPEGCRWCRMKGNCLALSRACLRVGGAELLASDAVRSSKYCLDPEDVAKVLDALPQIQTWLDAVKDYAESRLLKGETIPGYKLVAGRAGARSWDGDKADAVMLKAKVKADYRYTKKVITPAQAEKLMKQGKIDADVWAELEKLVTRSEPAPVLVPDSDPRKPYRALTAEDFPDESGASDNSDSNLLTDKD